MHSRYVIVLDRSEVIARDVCEEIISIAPDTRVDTAPNAEKAARVAGWTQGLDLLVLSHRSEATPKETHLRQLVEAARAILIIGERPADARDSDGKVVYLSAAPFSDESLRRDLLSINLDGAPLFPH